MLDVLKTYRKHSGLIEVDGSGKGVMRRSKFVNELLLPLNLPMISHVKCTGGGKVCFEKSRYIVDEPYREFCIWRIMRRGSVLRQSKYQKIDIIDNDAYGRMLFLDHNLQHTDNDAKSLTKPSVACQTE